MLPRPTLIGGIRFALALAGALVLPALLRTWRVCESLAEFSFEVLIAVGGILYAHTVLPCRAGYLLLRRGGKSSRAAHLGVGFASVALSIVAASLYYCLNGSCLADGLHYTFNLGFMGVLMGAAFWLIERPDRHEPTQRLARRARLAEGDMAMLGVAPLADETRGFKSISQPPEAVGQHGGG